MIKLFKKHSNKKQTSYCPSNSNIKCVAGVRCNGCEHEHDSLTEKESAIYFKGIALGQRMAGVTLLEKFSAINKNTKPALMKLIMTDINEYLNVISVMTPEAVESTYRKEQ